MLKISKNKYILFILSMFLGFLGFYIFVAISNHIYNIKLCIGYMYEEEFCIYAIIMLSSLWVIIPSIFEVEKKRILAGGVSIISLGVGTFVIGKNRSLSELMREHIQILKVDDGFRSVFCASLIKVLFLFCIIIFINMLLVKYNDLLKSDISKVKDDKTKKEKLFSPLYYIIFTIMLIFVISQKENFHTDELYTYALSNYTSLRLPERGINNFVDAKELYMEYLTVSENNTFNYHNVWEQQKNDVHPPFYYLLVHTISSLFPETFSIWYAGIINIIYALLILYIMRKICRLLVGDNYMLHIISISTIICGGILETATFLRMYMAVMFWILCITYIIIKEIKAIIETEHISFYGILQIFAVSVAGTLTHYYFVIYLFFACLCLGLLLLIKRYWFDIVQFIVCMVNAGITAYLIFPSIIDHVFFGYQGQATFEQFENNNIFSWGERAYQVYMFFNKYLFGGCIPIVILLGGVSIWKYVRNKKIINKKQQFVLNSLLLMLFSSFGYYVVNVISSPIARDRYFSPIYAVVLLLGWLIVYYSMNMFQYKKYVKNAIVILCTVSCIGSIYLCEWGYLYKNNSDVEVAKKYSDRDCLYLYDKVLGSDCVSAFLEVENYNQVAFVKAEKLEEYLGKKQLKAQEYMVYVTDNCDQKEKMDKLCEYVNSISMEKYDYELIIESEFRNSKVYLIYSI